MAIQKKEYELSIRTEHLNNEGIKVEEKGAIIGAHNMDYLGRATDVKLTRKINGTNVLSFQIPSKFFDSEKGSFIHNELSDMIKNETKIKLYYLDKWFEFYVKSITEDKQFKAIMYQYSCEDSFIDELSRTGYEIQFDNELNNSVEEIGIFSEEVLEDSIWDYHPEYNTGDFTEFNEQRFYKIPLSQFGGSIAGYRINLKVGNNALLNEDGAPKEYLQKRLKTDELIWEDMTKEQREKYLNKILSISNIFTHEQRNLQYGDDLARVEELFWDPYYLDNGEALLSSSNKYTLTGRYIYVPITDLTTIMGTVYEDSYHAVEEPALYGNYLTDTKKTYALQPSSKNPRKLIQFIFLSDGDEYNIDEAGVLANNEYHYVIPIEEWNEILETQLKDKTGVIYWTQPHTDSGILTEKYDTAADSENNMQYTINVMPYSSTIDDFTWYPVYTDGYLDQLGDEEVTQARKFSVTDRTEFNKEADTFVTVYKNKSSEYKKDNLYSDEELSNQIGNNPEQGQEFRVTSKEQTRLIVPTLARNLVENGSKITDTNGWEARTQNRNHEKLTGVGSAVDLLKVNVQSTIQRGIDNTNVTIDEYDIDGTMDDEIISDYYLEIQSPGFNKTEDFSLEGTTQIDYLLNFGLISQEKKIEKDKVYALRMKTGNMIETGVTLSYRALEKVETYNEDFKTKVSSYEKTFDEYKNLYDALSNFSTISEKLREKYSAELELFSDMIKTWPSESDQVKNDKLKIVDSLLEAILFGGSAALWSDANVQTDGKESIALLPAITYQGIIAIHDKNFQNNYEKFSAVAIPPTLVNGKKQYSSSDIRFLKYCLYNNLEAGAIKTNTYLTADGVQLTNSMIRNWKETCINYNKIFEQKLNKDLDRLVIGKGAIDLNGNYIIQGNYDDNGISPVDGEYISFKDLFSSEGIIVVPRRDLAEKSIQDKLGITKDIYHIKSNRNWTWDTNSATIGIKDEPFLIFKATQTIENPYIGIRLESGKLEIIFDSIQKTTYVENLNSGVQINVVEKVNNNNYYYDDIPIKVVPISPSTCTDEFLEKIGYAKEDGTFDTTLLNNDITWKNEYLKNTFNSWTGKTNAATPAYNRTFLKSGNDNYSIPYLLILNDKVIGITYLQKVSTSINDGGED